MSTKTSHKRHSQQAEQANRPTLQHVTVSTGHNCDSPMSEVNRDRIVCFQEWLMDGEIIINPSGEKSLIQSLPEEHLAVVTPRGDTLLCTVLDPAGDSVVTFSVNGGDAESQWAWDHLHELQTHPIYFKKSPGKVPDGRWCGVVLHQRVPSFGSHFWLADFERSLAWAWLTWSDENKEAFRAFLDYPSTYSEWEEFVSNRCSVCGWVR